MSEHNDNFPLYSLFETFTEELEEFEDDIDSDCDDVTSDNTGSDYEFFDPCDDLNNCNTSFLCKIFENNDEISSSDSDNYENETELDFENENENENESEDNQFSHNDGDEFYEIIEILEQKELTACVVIDFINGKFQQCGQKKGSIRQLRNLYGTWQVDRDAIKEVNGNLPKLGVCDLHFQFDNKYLHKSREEGCIQHSWHLNGHNIQVPCIGQYSCEALKVCRPLFVKAFNNIKNPKSICCLCYEKLGG